MNTDLYKHWPQRLIQRWVLNWYRANPVWLAVAGLLALSLWAWGWALPHLQDRLTLAQEDLIWETQLQQRRLMAGQTVKPTSEVVHGVDSLRRVLGEQRTLSRDLQRVHDLAVSAGLALPQGEYRQSCDAEIEVCRFHMQFELLGSYDRIRAWVQAVMQALPHAAVDTLVLARETVADEEVVVTLGLTLYVKTPSAGRAHASRSTP